MTTAELLRLHSTPIAHADHEVSEPREHRVYANRVGLELRTDVIDATPSPAPAGTFRRLVAGDRHAVLRLPVPLWLADLWQRVRWGRR